MKISAKIFTAVVLSIILSLACFAAQTYVDSQGVTYTLEETTAFVGGMDRAYNTARYTGDGDIVIPSELNVDGKTYKVNKIEAFAFSNSPLSSIYIPSTITTIGYSAFAGCKNLAHFDVDDANNMFCDIDGNLFNKRTTRATLYAFADGAKREFYKVPDHVTIVAPGAFEGCVNLLSLNLNKVTAIDAFSFSNSSVKTAVCVGNTIAAGAFAKSQVENIVVLSSSVSTIGDAAFYDCKSLKTVVFPSVTTFSRDAFRGCDALEKIVLCTAVSAAPVIEADAFEGVPKDCKLIYRGGNAAFDLFASTLTPVKYTSAKVTPYTKLSDMFSACRSVLYKADDTGKTQIAFNAYNSTEISKTVNAYVAFYNSDGALIDVKMTQEKTVLPYGAVDYFVEAPEGYASYSVMLLDGDLAPVGVTLDGVALG